MDKLETAGMVQQSRYACNAWLADGDKVTASTMYRLIHLIAQINKMRATLTTSLQSTNCSYKRY